MIQYRNHTIVKALRAVLVVMMMLLTGDHALAQSTGVHVMGNVYGGGNLANVGGSVTVNMTSGTVDNDVYGGGALANTNVNNTTDLTINITTVNLLGGTINGDAYGGGLGQRANNNATPAVTAVEAKVFGDVKIYLNGMDKSFYDAADATMKAVFDTRITKTNGATFYLVNASTKGAVVKRVFGANNKNGSPQGNVTVHVFGTQHENAENIRTKLKNANADLEKGSLTDEQYIAVLKGVLTDMITKAGILHITVTNNEGTGYQDICNNSSSADDLKKAINDINDEINAKVLDENTSTDDIDALFARIYDVEAVYGGGNEAAYIPATAWDGSTGSKTQVIIEGCDETSIEAVYGGGNAASVPETNVDIVSAHEIQTVFGGGNGKDATSYGANPGADVGVYKVGETETEYGTGNATTLLKGGYIHEAYGASNQKGNIKGKININTNPQGTCNLNVEKLVGAGKNADVDGDLIMILGCKPTTQTPLIFAGADNANVNGNVELTITSGTFGKVFGGNNLGGAIKGHIVLNIEETGCNPIRIDELYLGGNQAAYSIYGYYEDASDNNKLKPRTAAMHAITDPGATGYVAPLPNPANTDNKHPFPYAQPVLNIVSATSIGKVFGGGLGEGAVMHADPTVNINMIKGTATGSLSALGTIGDVFGGGNAADVYGNTTVNIGTETKVRLHESLQADGVTYNMSAEHDVLGANITGNVFGGGNQANVIGNTKVNICGTQNPALDSQSNPVLDSEGKPTYTDTSVSHSGTEGFAVSIGNSVYGGGSEADVEGNTFVTMADGYVFNGIFGGGLAGSVGKFTRDKTVTLFGHTAHDGCIGKPTSCEAGTGTCYVVVSGGQIGPVEVATKGMTRLDAEGGPVPEGWVWGGGCGIVEDPADHPDTHFKAYVNNTDVTIKDNAFILESIIGGGEFGRVLGNTLVKIQGGQIGVGVGQVDDNGKPIRYDEAKFIDPTSKTITNADTLGICSHSPYGRVVDGKKVYKIYDPYADDAPNLYPGGSTDAASDGKTWIGCVFAGGSGYMPVVKAKSGNTVTNYDWISSAGWVEGNAEVRISGGHILTNVYGGNEVTSVQGTSKVTMTGGTIGVPRTKEQIEALPMTGFLFGAGKGDPRSHFDSFTNVQDVEIEITGGIIYGSVYGGSEDGHVLGTVTINISEGTEFTIGGHTYDKPIIGTWGTSYFDGNVFGGGRGFSGGNLNAGSVGGTVTMNITGGKMLGSVYGGGRLGSVNDDITINISGGTIGNNHEYTYDADHEVTHTKGGNVFAGGKGRMYQLDGTTPISAVNWWELGSAKSTKVTISNDAVIKSCVYGGGELGQVVGTHASKNAKNEDVNISTEVIINGGTIGTEIKDGETVKYTFGSVFGGGYGSLDEKLTHNEGTASESVSYPKYIAGRVKGGTKVNMTAGAVLASVYGGGEMAAVGESTALGETLTDGLTGDTHVIISGGTIGESGFGGAKMGNVYGGGSGHNNTVRSGHVYGNTNVTINAGTESGEPKIYHNVYGGGAYGSVGEFVYETKMVDGAPKVSGITGLSADHDNTGVATVTITGGTIGVNGKENGMVFGSSRGDINQPGERDDHTAWVYDTNVTIGDNNGGPAIKGSIYGSGENGHTFNDVVVTINKGTIGIADSSDPEYKVTSSNGTEYSGAAYPYRGNVYGGGCGTDKYYSNHALETHDGNGQLYNPLAGIVYGTATVNINGGTVVRNVYGAGAMGSVGKVVSTTTEGVTTTTFTGGQTTINISGGTIGVDGTSEEGNVFGAARGALDATGNNLALVAEKTSVSITGGTMYGNVYGGGELGYVGKFTSVTNPETGSKTYTWPANSGLCNVTINGASAIVKGHVFGAGKGSSDTYECEPAMVYSTEVNISNGTVDGKVYGGGQLGRVENNTVVTIGTEGETEGTNKPDIKGDVFGAGAGVATHGYSALVRGNSTVTVQGKANVGGSVYGGGETASVGKFRVVNSLPKEPLSGGTCTVTINGGAAVTGDIFGACKGVTPDFAHNEGHWMNDNDNPHSFADEAEYLSFLKTLALTSNTNVTIGGSATVNGSVYGGGQRGITLGTVAVNMNGGTVNKDVYGGGALADTNTGNATGYGTDTESLTSNSTYTTTVNLMGGMIKGDAYGGGLGQLGTDPIPAKVYGNVAVNLGNVTENVDEASATKFWIDNYTGTHADVVKSGRIFGCNNLNGTPLGNVTVTVNRTVAGNVTRTASANLKNTNATHTYEVAAVYGGGNLAGYVPSSTVIGAKLKVLINSCDVSIDEVYGGGNAAPVPATDVEVMGAYEINQVFGGGNGKDEYTLNGTDWIENPGANIGGNTNTILRGGLIHEAYGGSNEKGEIAGDIVIDTGSGGCTGCPLDLEKMVGAGKNADVNGNLIVVMGCKPATKIPLLYAGADNANVNGNVELTITSGNFGKVFGGNNEGGAIRGHIIVNIEETGTCETPITIDELYLGGNMAAYSRFGYYIKTDETVAGTGYGAPGEHAVLTEGRLTFLPRTSADDTHKVVKSYNNENNTWEIYSGTEGDVFSPYAEPVLNVVSCTSIGEVFGGGYGVGGTMYADPTVNINMIPGSHASGVPDVMTAKELTATENPNNLGIIGNVYGGGNEADVIGNPAINIATVSKVRLHQSYDKANENNGYNGYTMSAEQDVLGAYIIGDVFGGGKGKDDSFTCEKAMIGVDGEGETNPIGGTTVNIYNGTVRGNVYGGGEIGRVEKNAVVTIGTGDGVAPGGTPTSAPIIMGSVFGGGKGKETHGYAALVRGNPTVTVQGNAKVLKSVYGGGEIASVARYKVAKDEQEAAAHGVAVDMPYVLANTTSGNCIVTVRGYAEIGPDGMQMYHEGVAAETDKPDDTGYVFGAGKGILPGGEYDYVQDETKRMVSVKDAEGNIIGSEWQYFATEADYIAFIQTLALASKTKVTIGGHALVKGSVYGGSENGLVQFDTDVKIQGDCQIGVAEGEGKPDCAHWEFKAPYAPYDPYATHKKEADGKYYYDENYTEYAEGGASIATDGHTYYGNVFGGGSGSIPYFDAEAGRSKYLSSAGMVKGNTYVTISGGHILTNVYGGCEATNVLGKATVTMTAGTVGVERTDEQIIAHPLTGYIFGGGKGDQRIFFNKDTNVNDAEVTVEGGRIYGSVYGGGEDGHVLRHVKMTIGKSGETTGPTIGTRGTSYYDGHVFGGGRGFGGEALTAGNVGGSVDLTIHGGSILGSVYGGGRLASVGYGLYLTTEEGYGILRADNEYDDATNPPYGAPADAADYFGTKGRGHINVIINGGTIGNTAEYAYDADARITHTKGGNVFAGSMGRLYKLDGSTPNIVWQENADPIILWEKLAHAKQTTLTINGGTIRSCVYGGGELGMVDGTTLATGQYATTVNITGGSIGTEVKDNNSVTQYTFGSVFGGGYGSTVEAFKDTDDKEVSNPKLSAGLITRDTHVTMSSGTVLASVYGGGETASVDGNAVVAVSGGTIGKNKDADHNIYYGGATMGNVYGGGSGFRDIVRAGHIFGNTTVNISGSPTIYHNVYGGGAYGTVGDFEYETTYDAEFKADKVTKVIGLKANTTGGTATILITGGTIGVDGKENGMVFGSSRGDVDAPGKRDDFVAWVYDTHVTIGNADGGPQIKGSVYGSGENGHTFHDAEVIIHKGTIGDTSDASFPNRGNVYGGGCGTDVYYTSDKDGNITVAENYEGTKYSWYNPLAGIVYGDATVTIDGGTVVHNVYGAGAMGSVGKLNTDGTVTGGTTTINISGGTIGVDGTAGEGNVFGAARGADNATGDGLALVRKKTNISISGTTQSTPQIKGNVYGGGELGCVGTFSETEDGRFVWTTGTGDSNVEITGGSITGNVFGAGKGKDDTFKCEKGMVKETSVIISAGTVGGDVYGGGEVGRVEYDTEVKIGNGAGTEEATPAPAITGSVFGGGAGVETHGYSALVRGNTKVTVEGNAQVQEGVYGGGEIASVGRYGLDPDKMPSILLGGGECTVTVQGHATIGADVFGAGKGVDAHFDKDHADKTKRSRRMTLYTGATDFPNGEEGITWERVVTGSSLTPGTTLVWEYFQTEADYSTYLETLALATKPILTIGGNAAVSGSVYGGGEIGLTKGSVIVNILGGTITNDVYGGGALANTNTTSSIGKKDDNDVPIKDSQGNIQTETVHPTTTVTLDGGIVGNNVYGGGLGRLAKEGVTAVEAKVCGDVLVKLNGPEEVTQTTGEGDEAVTTTTTTYGNCVVKGSIFGCNNLNGSPQKAVTVHVYKTAHVDNSGNVIASKPQKESDTYELNAVYGGGNLAPFIPDLKETCDTVQPRVIIDGCDLTSIRTVYGGGNAASVPATNVTINSAYEIDEVFGGGNGKDDISRDGNITYIKNPGANVGFKDYWDYTNNRDLEDYDTKDERQSEVFIANYVFGSGEANVNIYGGRIHRVFGGSNTKGNVRKTAVTVLDNQDPCDLDIDEAYGGGKSAPMDAEAKLLMACIPGLKVAYGGAQDADIQNDVVLNITNGTFDRVFGGNNISGTIRGTITVNVEETGCRPVIIGQLYGGGNQASYKAPEGQPGPTVNVKSFTSIGEVYGGGYGESAVVEGDTYVNINVCNGKWIGNEDAGQWTSSYDTSGLTGEKTISFVEYQRQYNSTTKEWDFVLDEDNNRKTETKTIKINLPPHTPGKIGAINKVFGGGNAAKVVGSTNVNIGTEDTQTYVSIDDDPATTEVNEKVKPVVGADIRGNVYGGGNQAEVTGNTNVVIGKEKQP